MTRRLVYIQTRFISELLETFSLFYEFLSVYVHISASSSITTASYTVICKTQWWEMKITTRVTLVLLRSPCCTSTLIHSFYSLVHSSSVSSSLIRRPNPDNPDNLSVPRVCRPEMGACCLTVGLQHMTALLYLHHSNRILGGHTALICNRAPTARYVVSTSRDLRARCASRALDFAVVGIDKF